jgi:hypothetical protein
VVVVVVIPRHRRLASSPRLASPRNITLLGGA